MVISQWAPLDLLWAEMPGRRRRAAIPFCWFSALNILENGVIGKFAFSKQLSDRGEAPARPLPSPSGGRQSVSTIQDT